MASGQPGDEQPFEAGPTDRIELDRSEPDERAVLALHDRLDQVHRQLATLVDVDLGAALPSLADQGRRLEHSIGDILLGLATMADHLGGKVVDDVGASAADDLLALRPGAPDDGSPPAGLGQVAAQLDALVAAARADRQRFQRLGGSIDGLAELLGMVTERLDRLGQLPGRPDRWNRPVDDDRPPLATSVGGDDDDPTGDAGRDRPEAQAVISGPDASVLAAMAEARHDAGAADQAADAVADQAAHAVADQDEAAGSSGLAGLDVTGPPEQDGAAPDAASTPQQLPEDAPARVADDRAGPDAVGLRRRRRSRRRRGRARRNPGR